MIRDRLLTVEIVWVCKTLDEFEFNLESCLLLFLHFRKFSCLRLYRKRGRVRCHCHCINESKREIDSRSTVSEEETRSEPRDKDRKEMALSLVFTAGLSECKQDSRCKERWPGLSCLFLFLWPLPRRQSCHQPTVMKNRLSSFILEQITRTIGPCWFALHDTGSTTGTSRMCSPSIDQ